MQAQVAFAVVLFAAPGLWTSASASPAATYGQPAGQAASVQPAIDSVPAVRTAPPLTAITYTPPATPRPATGQATVQPTTTPRQETSPDGSSDRSDMAMMLLVALAMVTTVVFKGGRS